MCRRTALIVAQLPIAPGYGHGAFAPYFQPNIAYPAFPGFYNPYQQHPPITAPAADAVTAPAIPQLAAPSPNRNRSGSNGQADARLAAAHANGAMPYHPSLHPSTSGGYEVRLRRSKGYVELNSYSPALSRPTTTPIRPDASLQPSLLAWKNSPGLPTSGRSEIHRRCNRPSSRACHSQRPPRRYKRPSVENESENRARRTTMIRRQTQTGTRAPSAGDDKRRLANGHSFD